MTAGDAPHDLLLLHGSAAGGARLSYGELVPALARHFTVVAPDFPGYGESEETPSARTAAGLVGFAVAFLEPYASRRARRPSSSSSRQ